MGGGAVAGGAVEAHVGVIGAVAGDLAVAARIDGGLVGKNGGDVHRLRLRAHRDGGEAMVLPEVFAELVEESVLSGKRQISHTDPGRIALATCATAGDDGKPALPAFRDEQGFVFHGVDRIDHPVHLAAENLLHGALGEKPLDYLQFAVGIDRPHPLGHRRGFLSPDLAVHRVELAVDVGDADLIEVDHTDLPDPGPRQRLDRPRSHPSDPNDNDTRSQKVIQSLPPVQPCYPAKPVGFIFTQHRAAASGHG